MSDTSKTAKIIQRWYHSPSHRLTVNGVSTFLLVVNDDHARILHVYGDTGLQKFWGHKFDLLGSRDVIGHVIIGLGICGFLLVVHCNHASVLHRYGDRLWGPKDIMVTILTFWGHVTSSITWPSDSAWALSCWWSMMAMRLSCTDTQIRTVPPMCLSEG